MTEMFPTAEGGVDGFLADLRRCPDRRCEAEKRELLDALRQAHHGTPNYVGEFGEYCGHCNACIDCQELHDEACPNRKIEALLKRWEGQ